MKKLMTILLVLFVGVVTVNAQETITFGWEYNAAEAARVVEWRLYRSDTSGQYTTTPFAIITKTGDQSQYTATIPETGIPNSMQFFVLTAYGDENFIPRESGYSNEVFYDFSIISAPFQLIITVQ